MEDYTIEFNYNGKNYISIGCYPEQLNILLPDTYTSKSWYTFLNASNLSEQLLSLGWLCLYHKELSKESVDLN